ILGRTGEAFWQDESFDHRVRDEVELERIVRYVENNPVSAGLAVNPRAWPWSSARLAGESACPTVAVRLCQIRKLHEGDRQHWRSPSIRIIHLATCKPPTLAVTPP